MPDQQPRPRPARRACSRLNPARRACSRLNPARSLYRACSRLLLALSFLSRLAPARLAEEHEISASLAWYPLAGLIIGLVLALPFALAAFAAPLRIGSKAVLAALLFVAFHAWLTRALHWDGWADLFDALGGGHSTESFQAILKDSRLGAFGGIALCLGLLAMFVSAAHCLAAARWPVLVWAVLLGRCLVAPLAWRCPPAPGSSLGRLMPPGAGLAALLAALFLSLGLGLILVGPFVTLFSLALALAGVLFLRRLAARRGGLNGDFLGAAITWGELAGLLTAAWVQDLSLLL